jgi:hypothetical protein
MKPFYSFPPGISKNNNPITAHDNVKNTTVVNDKNPSAKAQNANRTAIPSKIIGLFIPYDAIPATVPIIYIKVITNEKLSSTPLKGSKIGS